MIEKNNDLYFTYHRSCAIILITGRINLSIKFKKQVAAHFAQSKNISEKKFSYHQLEGLPEPVKRYFKHVSKEGQSYISHVRLKKYA